MKIRLHPAGLNPGEKAFIDDLSKHVKRSRVKEKFNEKSFFVLRNLPKKGIGFYDITNFFPEFLSFGLLMVRPSICYL